MALTEKATKIGVFVAAHNAITGAGDAHVTVAALPFTDRLQPYDISERARGVVDNVRGAIDAEFAAHWGRQGVTTSGRIETKAMSFASASLGPISGVTANLTLDDLAAMTSPPGQKIIVARMNPGIAIENGALSIQLKPDANLAIESAEWPFAGGTLAVAPTTLHLTGAETRLALTMRGVDVAALTEALNIKGLQATGRVEGNFPLVFTKTAGRIEHGRLTAAPGGGTIAYIGDVRAAGGAGAIAFDALRAFHYDALSLDLDGALDGELVSAIHFTGQNRAPLNPGAGVVPIKVVGLPFKFTVTVRAPFMALAQSASRIGDARAYLKDAATDVKAKLDAPAPPP